MFCPNCGRELKEGVVFCPNCGTKINSTKNAKEEKNVDTNIESVNDLSQQNVFENKNLQQNNQNSFNNKNVEKINKKVTKKKGNFPIIIFLLVLLLVLAAIIYKFVLPNFGVSSISLPKVSNFLISKKVSKNPVYYVKNDKLYDTEGSEDQEPIEKNVSSDLYYNDNNKEYYFIKNENLYKLKNGESEKIHSGVFIEKLTKNGCIFSDGEEYYLYDGEDNIKVGNICFYDKSNDKIFFQKDSNCYILSNDGEKEKIASDVYEVGFLEGRGFYYINADGIYLYKNGENKQIADNSFNVISDDLNNNIIYLYKLNKLNIVDYVKVDDDYQGAEPLRAALNTNDDKHITYSVYAYDVNKDNMVLLMEDTNYILNDFLVCNKPIGMVDKNNKINYANIQFNSYESANDTIKNAVLNNVFINDTYLNYCFLGTDFTLLQMGDNKYTKDSPFVQYDDGYISVIINGNENGELYYGKVQLNDVTKLDLVDDKVFYAMNISSKGIYYMTLDNKLMFFDGKNTKEIEEGIFECALKDDNMYLLANWDDEAKNGSLYKYNLSNGEKEKIESRVQSIKRVFSYSDDSEPFEEIKINSSFDGKELYFNENSILNDYTDKYMRIGWYEDENHKKIYYDSNHKKVVNSYQQIGEELYYFDSNGYLLTNDWYGDYYFGDDGKIQTDKWIGDYYVGSDGRYVKNMWIGLNYLDSSGLKAKNKWVGDYYVGADGQMVVNNWVDGYYVGSDGRYKRNSWIGSSYVGANGKKVFNSWVGDYYVGADGNYVKNTIVDGKTIGPDGRVVITSNSSNGNTSGNSSSTSGTSGTGTSGTGTSGRSVGMYTAGPNGEALHIVENTKIKEEVESDDEDRTCKITGLKPTIGGIKKDEVDSINDFISDQFDGLMEELISMAQASSPIPKTITMSKNEITTLTSKRLRITLTGKLTPKSGTSKTVKFRITYDREEEDGTIENLTSE